MSEANTLPRKRDIEALEKIEQIKPFLALANAVPADLPDLVERDQERMRELPSLGSAQWDAALESFSQESIRARQEAATRFDEPLRALLAPGGVIEPEVYELLRYVREMIKRLADARDVVSGPLDGSVNLGEMLPVPFSVSAEEAWVEAGKLRIREQNATVAQVHLQFRDALDKLPMRIGERSVMRIGECPVCGMFFWVKRWDQKACGEGHANTLRVRKHDKKKRERPAKQITRTRSKRK